MSTLLRSEKLNKSYHLGKETSVQVLHDIDLQIQRGEFVSVMGPSGSGKSTLLYTICGMDTMSSGSVRFNGRELANLREFELARLRLTDMGFIFQQSHLLKNLSIFDNIILSGYLAQRKSRSALDKRAWELMELTGIAPLARNTITQASGGQLQRVGICRALINEPEILFGDEPTGALDTKSSAEIMKLLQEINAAGTTVMLVTHDARVAAGSERVLYMVDGRIAAEKNLGKYGENGSDLQAREKLLSAWLEQQGIL